MSDSNVDPNDLELPVPPERLEVLESLWTRVLEMAGDMPSGEFGVVCLDLAARAFRGAGFGRRRFFELCRHMWVASAPEQAEAEEEV